MNITLQRNVGQAHAGHGAAWRQPLDREQRSQDLFVFCTCRMPDGLREFFAVKRLPAKYLADIVFPEVFLVGPCRGRGVGGALFSRRCPMGWAWALRWCQAAHERLVRAWRRGAHYGAPPAARARGPCTRREPGAGPPGAPRAQHSESPALQKPGARTPGAPGARRSADV